MGMGVLARALRNVSRSKVRTLLVSLALAFSIAILVSTLAGTNASEDTAQAMIENYKGHLQSTQQELQKMLLEINVNAKVEEQPSAPSEGEGWGIGSTGGIPKMDESVADDIAAMEGVEGVFPWLRKAFGEKEEVEENRPGYHGITIRMDIHYIVWGVPLDPSLDEQYHFLPVNIVDGRKISEGDEGSVLIGSDAADYFGAEVGDTIKIGGMDFQVVGIYSSSVDPIFNKRVYMSLSDAQSLLDCEGKISDLTVYAENLPAVDSVAAEIRSRYPNLRVITYRDRQTSTEYMQYQQQSAIERLEADLSQIQGTAKQVILVSIITAGLIILFLMFYTVRERTKEIGILKALGFSNRDVTAQFVFEGMCVGLIGGLIGILIAGVSAPILASLVIHPSETLGSTVTPSLNAQLALLALGVATLLGALGSLYPAWRASRVSPAEALRHE